MIPTTRFGNMRSDIWGRDHFVWPAKEDAYFCPAGEKLRRHTNVRRTSRIQYRAPRGSCFACVCRTQCTPSGRERTIHRSWAQDFVDVNEERLASPLGKQRLVERKIHVEGSFGLAKELHGLRRTRLKGRRSVQIQVWLTAATMNIQKAVRGMARSPGVTARLYCQAGFILCPSLPDSHPEAARRFSPSATSPDDSESAMVSSATQGEK